MMNNTSKLPSNVPVPVTPLFSVCGSCPGCQSFRDAGCPFCPNLGHRLTPPAPPPASPQPTVPESPAPAPTAPVATQTVPVPVSVPPLPQNPPADTAPPTAPNMVSLVCRCGHAIGQVDNFCGACGKPAPAPVAPEYVFVCQTPREPPHAVPLTQSAITVGKASECTLPLASDEYLSRKHLRLSLQSDGKILLEDLGSSNGTFMRVRQPIELQVGDEILAGSTILKLQKANSQ